MTKHSTPPSDCMAGGRSGGSQSTPPGESLAGGAGTMGTSAPSNVGEGALAFGAGSNASGAGNWGGQPAVHHG